MLSFKELDQGLREVVEFYAGELEVWELRREDGDFYLLVIPKSPEVLENSFAFRSVDKLVDCIRDSYRQEFFYVGYESAITGEDTELPYFCLKLKGY